VPPPGLPEEVKKGLKKAMMDVVAMPGWLQSTGTDESEGATNEIRRGDGRIDESRVRLNINDGKGRLAMAKRETNHNLDYPDRHRHPQAVQTVAEGKRALSSFRAAPRQGHMDRIKRVYGYVARMKHGAICFGTGVPDYTAIPLPEYSWIKTIYGEAQEGTPHDAPKPLRMPVRMTTYINANLCHDMTTGKAVTGVFHFYNYTKKEGTVETATYGPEYVAGRTATGLGPIVIGKDNVRIIPLFNLEADSTVLHLVDIAV
jgi:hypothetical protein